MRYAKLAGQTKDVGFEIGARKTYRVSPEKLWNWLVSSAGTAEWLGDSSELDFTPNARWILSDGREVKIVTSKPFHLRLSVQAAGNAYVSTIQVRLIPAKTGATVAFHEGKLPDSAARESRKTFWRAVLDLIEREFSGTI